MQIVIDIPEMLYEKIQNRKADKRTLETVILRGTPLPEGHGRLIDADETLKAMNTWDKFGYTETGCFVREPKNDYVPYVHYQDMVTSIVNAPTIIEGSDAE